jgi:histidine kinase-like protein
MHYGHPAKLRLAPARPGAEELPRPAAQIAQMWPCAAVPSAAGEHQRIAARVLGPELESCKAARDFTRATLHAWDLDMVLMDAAVVASELVTNALRHGMNGQEHSQAELIWWWQASHLLCVVIDPSTEPPVRRLASPAAQSGRGLQVVQAIASAWGWTPLAAVHKAVWADLPVPGPRAEPGALRSLPARSARRPMLGRRDVRRRAAGAPAGGCRAGGCPPAEISRRGKDTGHGLGLSIVQAGRGGSSAGGRIGVCLTSATARPVMIRC